jgi:hypothetical protein
MERMSLDKMSSEFDSVVDNNLGWLKSNKYVLPVIALFLILYVTSARPKLPKFIEDLFENPIFRLVVIAYIVYRANNDLQSAILIAALFLIIMHLINKNKAEGFNAVNLDQCHNSCGCIREQGRDGKMVLGCKNKITKDCENLNFKCNNKGEISPTRAPTTKPVQTTVPATTTPAARAAARVAATVAPTTAAPKPTQDPCTKCMCKPVAGADGRFEPHCHYGADVARANACMARANCTQKRRNQDGGVLTFRQ